MTLSAITAAALEGYNNCRNIKQDSVILVKFLAIIANIAIGKVSHAYSKNFCSSSVTSGKTSAA